MEHDAIDTCTNWYLPGWIVSLRVFLNWSEDRVREYATRWDWMSHDPNSLFYHERAMSYVVPLLMSRAMRDEVLRRRESIVHVKSRIQEAIEDAIPLPEELVGLHAKLKPGQWTERLSEFQSRAVNDGKWYAEGHEDKFDWNAARDRVERILNEYGASLDDLNED